jgi:hypothetical protein
MRCRGKIVNRFVEYNGAIAAKPPAGAKAGGTLHLHDGIGYYHLPLGIWTWL